MNRAFTEEDSGRVFRMVTGDIGTLEFPLEDPGSATEGQGVLWYEDEDGYTWTYVSPSEVQPVDEAI